jgi:ethanolamine utilization protein EutM
MNQYALGLIETAGYTAALSAADAALKTAKVSLIGVERVIGVNGSIGVTVQLSGDVGAVQSAVQAAKDAAEKVGQVISAHVIARAHDEVSGKLLPFLTFQKKEQKMNQEENKLDRTTKKKKKELQQDNETNDNNQSE